MMSGMYAAISGLDAHQTMLDVTANNLANVDTVGYKSQNTVFADELSQLIAGRHRPERVQRGHQPDPGRSWRQGRLDQQQHDRGRRRYHRNATDVAIQGDGFLQVANGAPASTTSTSP